MPEPVSSKRDLGVLLGPVKATSLHYIWICDVSDSMRHGNRIGELNMAIEKAIASLKEAGKKTPALQILMRTIKFSAGAEWVDNEFILLKNYQWRPLETTLGETDLGEALSQVADAVRFKKDGGLMPETRTRQPHLILVTDGYPTDEWESGLKKLMSTYWGGNAVRMAVALGDAADDDDTMDVLRQFVGNVRDADIRICSSDRIDESFFTNGLVILS